MKKWGTKWVYLNVIKGHMQQTHHQNLTELGKIKTISSKIRTKEVYLLSPFIVNITVILARSKKKERQKMAWTEKEEVKNYTYLQLYWKDSTRKHLDHRSRRIQNRQTKNSSFSVAKITTLQRKSEMQSPFTIASKNILINWNKQWKTSKIKL
jgi:hypothetical protein